MGMFQGFPAFTKFVQTKFENEPLLRDFRSVEQCSLEYDSSKGASIDPHVDDCWVWGERVVTVNCLGNSVLTLSRYVVNITPAAIQQNDKAVTFLAGTTVIRKDTIYSWLTSISQH